MPNELTKERLLMSIQTAKDNIKILEDQESEDAGHPGEKGIRQWMR